MEKAVGTMSGVWSTKQVHIEGKRCLLDTVSHAKGLRNEKVLKVIHTVKPSLWLQSKDQIR